MWPWLILSNHPIIFVTESEEIAVCGVQDTRSKNDICQTMRKIDNHLMSLFYVTTLH
jgi:hypothetical protein